MKPLRITDGYTEIAALERGRLVELYITKPGSDSVVTAHASAKLLFHLACWLAVYWIYARLCGLRDRFDAKKARKEVSEVPDVEYGTD